MPRVCHVTFTSWEVGTAYLGVGLPSARSELPDCFSLSAGGAAAPPCALTVMESARALAVTIFSKQVHTHRNRYCFWLLIVLAVKLFLPFLIKKCRLLRELTRSPCVSRYSFLPAVPAAHSARTCTYRSMLWWLGFAFFKEWGCAVAESDRACICYSKQQRQVAQP